MKNLIMSALGWIRDFFVTLCNWILGAAESVTGLARPLFTIQNGIVMSISLNVVLALIIFVGSDRAFEPGPIRLVDPTRPELSATMGADLARICSQHDPVVRLTLDDQVIELFITEPDLE